MARPDLNFELTSTREVTSWLLLESFFRELHLPNLPFSQPISWCLDAASNEAPGETAWPAKSHGTAGYLGNRKGKHSSSVTTSGFKSFGTLQIYANLKVSPWSWNRRSWILRVSHGFLPMSPLGHLEVEEALVAVSFGHSLCPPVGRCCQMPCHSSILWCGSTCLILV